MLLSSLSEDVSRILLGKRQQVDLALCCILAQGHLLIEDLPGMGKTTLAHALMKVLGLEFQRVQFTSDLLPSDVLGVAIFDRDSSEFSFQPGPIFTQLLLVDEINRASPKTQSALLEAMAEQQVTVEGQTRPLPEPFVVIATQNPLFQSGTFALPESQLDRFLMCLSLGYPDDLAERDLLTGVNPQERLEALEPRITPQQLKDLQAQVSSVVARDAVLDYVQRLVAFTREDSFFAYGLSTRASLALLHCAKAWAMLSDRDYVLPEDVQMVLAPVCGHRLHAARAAAADRTPSEYLLERVAVI